MPIARSLSTLQSHVLSHHHTISFAEAFDDQTLADLENLTTAATLPSKSSKLYRVALNFQELEYYHPDVSATGTEQFPFSARKLKELRLNFQKGNKVNLQVDLSINAIYGSYKLLDYPITSLSADILEGIEFELNSNITKTLAAKKLPSLKYLKISNTDNSQNVITMVSHCPNLSFFNSQTLSPSSGRTVTRPVLHADSLPRFQFMRIDNITQTNSNSFDNYYKLSHRQPSGVEFFKYSATLPRDKPAKVVFPAS
ncbi:hypothetical protein WICPIJ_006057 [Wickerhamomyces pijperi]|uniref:Uncharacterized protein n=1 Tax=Wickerhamomyces pijperi TaxID=599730 RepID=A0A9P8TLD4_WICPI|nr:hypothetical protein WICPIJ_006057 [Wickerhamomyces pijperi]